MRVKELEPRGFQRSELLAAVSGALLVQLLVAGLLVLSTRQGARPPPPVEYVEVTLAPPPKDLPLLKLGGKKPMSLPDLNPKPVPVRRQQAPAPPPAPREPSPPPTPSLDTPTPVEAADAGAPTDAGPSDASTAKTPTAAQVDQPDVDTSDAAAPNYGTEGAADGVKEGTEADPLKARAVDRYRWEIIQWFNSLFSIPLGSIPCEELKTLSVKLTATVDDRREVTGYAVTRPSGSAVFDERVVKAMTRAVGQDLQAPPPGYPDALQTHIRLEFSGRDQPCD